MIRKKYTTDRKFKNDRTCSLDEVAIELGVSIERARVIEKDALRKCKDWCDEHNYDLEMLLSVFASEKLPTFTLHPTENESAD